VILSLAPVHLDLAPRSDAVSPALAVGWSMRVPPNSFFLRYAEHVLVTDRKSIAVLGAAGEALAPLDLKLKDYYPSGLGDPVLLDRSGNVFLWRPPEAPRLFFRFPEPGEYAAASLGGTRLLILRYQDGAMSGASAVDAADGRVLWSSDAEFHLVAVTPEGILASTAAVDGLECHDPESGQRRWTVPWSGADLFGIVDGIAWGPGQNELQRIDCATGNKLTPVQVDNAKNPRGVVDERGIFHCCHGLSYQTYDLRNNGQRLSYSEFRLTAAGPSLGAGPSGTLIATDGRLIFSDQRGAIWVVHPNQPDQPELVWRARGVISGLAVRDSAVLVAEASGSITALAGAAG